MPWTDWQFWVVSGVALMGAWVVLRQFMPRRSKRGSSKRVTLTVDRKEL